MKKIIVLGGGSAGWLTALLTREFYPGFDITLIESEDIGILGAGEGTVPYFIDVLHFLRIPVSALIKECNATIKIGIKFTNWNGDGTSYFHDFFAKEELEETFYDDLFRQNVLSTYFIGKNIHLDKINFFSRISEQAKVPFILNDLNDINLDNYPNPMAAVQHLGNFALHFNAQLLAQFLGKVAQNQRNIKRIEGRFTHAVSDENGNITKIVLESGQEVACDFIFDCSGFARLLLGRHFDEKWIDYKQYLPLDSALPFFIPHDGRNYPPITESIALKHGWMWKIPVQDRYGCGYVFDSSFINETQAQEELEEYLGHSISSPKTFRFKAGTFENALVKNCLGVGLSHHFVEPLEATSIWTFTRNLMDFLKSDAINHLNPETAALINENVRKTLEPIPEFLHLHYLTQRRDSEFWMNFRENTNTMPSLKKKLNLWEHLPLFDHDVADLRMFISQSWISVGDGVRIFNREAFRRLSKCWDHRQLDQKAAHLMKKHEHLSRACMLHHDFISFLRDN